MPQKPCNSSQRFQYVTWTTPVKLAHQHFSLLIEGLSVSYFIASVTTYPECTFEGPSLWHDIHRRNGCIKPHFWQCYFTLEDHRSVDCGSLGVAVWKGWPQESVVVTSGAPANLSERKRDFKVLVYLSESESIVLNVKILFPFPV